jgi:hypothetical protein
MGQHTGTFYLDYEKGAKGASYAGLGKIVSCHFKTLASADQGASLMLILGGGMHLAHSLDVNFSPFALYVSVPLEWPDLKALMDGCSRGDLDADGLRAERVMRVGKRLGVKRTLAPPSYPVATDWESPPYYVAIGWTYWDARDLIPHFIVLWPQEWEAFCAGAKELWERVQYLNPAGGKVLAGV